jgi:hypothetical protein
VLDVTPDPAAQHEVRIVDGRFAHAVCTCGWRGAGRRNRGAARSEARDHALLYADGRVLGSPREAEPVVVLAEPVEVVEA